MTLKPFIDDIKGHNILSSLRTASPLSQYYPRFYIYVLLFSVHTPSIDFQHMHVLYVSQHVLHKHTKLIIVTKKEQFFFLV